MSKIQFIQLTNGDSIIGKVGELTEIPLTNQVAYKIDKPVSIHIMGDQMAFVPFLPFTKAENEFIVPVDQVVYMVDLMVELETKYKEITSNIVLAKTMPKSLITG